MEQINQKYPIGGQSWSTWSKKKDVVAVHGGAQGGPWYTLSTQNKFWPPKFRGVKNLDFVN